MRGRLSDVVRLSWAYRYFAGIESFSAFPSLHYTVYFKCTFPCPSHFKMSDSQKPAVVCVL